MANSNNTTSHTAAPAAPDMAAVVATITPAELALALHEKGDTPTTSPKLTRAQLARRRRCAMAGDANRRYDSLDRNDAVMRTLEAR